MYGNARNNGGVAGFNDRTKTSPIPVQRTTRVSNQRVLTSLNAGKMVPVMAIPLLREDSVSRASFRIGFEMEETVELLMNAINVRVLTYLVPKLAFERFDGLDAINRSYEGVNFANGQAPPAWFDTMVAPAVGANPILLALGKHFRPGTTINTEYIEAYNTIWNFRAKNRSPDIPLRTALDSTLAPGFWQHQTFAHIVPDFDQAIIDGEIPLNVTASNITLTANGQLTLRDGSTASMPLRTNTAGDGGAIPPGLVLLSETTAAVPGSGLFYSSGIAGELAENGITISLSNIELARKTQAFAALRRQYTGHSDEFLIDLLMDGIQIPDAAWKQPMLLSDVSTVFGMSKRYASDGASLTESVVNGATMVDVRFSVPRVNTGGIIMMCVEIAPEQLFERQRDPYLHSVSVSTLPQFLRDTLDPEKVEVVTNEMVDLDHSAPTGTFGYAPLNHNWAKSIPQVGGKFHRPEVDGAFDEDRQRIWAVETVDPVLSQDFYLTTTMHYKPFVVTDDTIDHFECLIRGQAVIRGNTVFGGALVEATDDYEEVLAEAPTDRIDKPAATDSAGKSDAAE